MLSGDHVICLLNFLWTSLGFWSRLFHLFRKIITLSKWHQRRLTKGSKRMGHLLVHRHQPKDGGLRPRLPAPGLPHWLYHPPREGATFRWTSIIVWTEWLLQHRPRRSSILRRAILLCRGQKRPPPPFTQQEEDNPRERHNGHRAGGRVHSHEDREKRMGKLLCKALGIKRWHGEIILC